MTPDSVRTPPGHVTAFPPATPMCAEGTCFGTLALTWCVLGH
jgi:hypothetical protein